MKSQKFSIVDKNEILNFRQKLDK